MTKNQINLVIVTQTTEYYDLGNTVVVEDPKT